MPARAPDLDGNATEYARTIGEALRRRREALKLAATTTAKAAGLSRMTLHRIERGEPSVTLGAFANVASALGVELRVVDPQAEPATAKAGLPAHIRLEDYPQLAALAWQRDLEAPLTPRDALDLYERNWRHLDRDAMSDAERELLDRLVEELAGGRPLV